MYKIIALFGPSGSGKDSLEKTLKDDSIFNEIISCTTRPKREKEQDGVDYFFLTKEEFAKKVLNGSMLEATSFRDWFYGTPLESLKEDKINVGVFNISGIECLLKDSNLKVIPIYITCESKTRLLRSLEREKNPDCEEICRRFLSDLQDFEVIDFHYLIYYNGNKISLDNFKGYIKEQLSSFD